LHIFWALSLSIGMCACLDPFCPDLLKSFFVLQLDGHISFKLKHFTCENSFLTLVFHCRVIKAWCSGMRTTWSVFLLYAS
jgi:hypothetical protein